MLLPGINVNEDGSPHQIMHSSTQSVRPYTSNQAYLYAMREDLADWLKGLYAVDITPANFFDVLETGTLLCQHSNNITTCALYMLEKSSGKEFLKLSHPTKFVAYNQGRYVRAGSFFARDNIANFINWCRHELHVLESVMFETNDLVQRLNEKNVILCLLEVARCGTKFGIPAPTIIQMEQDIDNEIEIEKSHEDSGKVLQPQERKVSCDFKSLDEMVQYILGLCTCPNQFPMIKVSDGKYKVGDSANIIFMRILRQHVMVRVGGGWDTLEHYLDKHDPCRCQRHKFDKSLRQSRALSASNPNIAKLTTSRSSLSSTRLIKSKSQTNLNQVTSPVGNTSTSKHGNRYSLATTPRKNDRLSVGPQPRAAGRHSTNQTSAKTSDDVFSRLSRPKSTPPEYVQNDVPGGGDHLVVRRSKIGSHLVQRSPRSSPTKNDKKFEFGANMPSAPPSSWVNVAANHSRRPSRSSCAKPPTRRDVNRPDTRQAGRESSCKSDRQQNIKNGHQRLGSSSVQRMLSENSRSDQSMMDDKELEILQIFEKECLTNQASLNTRPNLTYPADRSSQHYSEELSPMSEDSTLGIKGTIDCSKPPIMSPKPHAKPRKDRGEQQRKSRIPTPVMFYKPTLSTRTSDAIQAEAGKKRSLSSPAATGGGPDTAHVYGRRSTGRDKARVGYAHGGRKEMGVQYPATTTGSMGNSRSHVRNGRTGGSVTPRRPQWV